MSEGAGALPGSPRAPAAAALGAALVLTGAGFQTPAALVPGVALVLLAAITFAWVELAGRWARLDRRLGPRRIVEGEPYRLRIAVRGGLLPPPGGDLIDPLLKEPVPVDPRWDGHLHRTVRLRGPGRRALGRATLVIGDPLGLWRRSIRSEDAGDVVVLPRVEPVRPVGGNGDALGQTGASDESAQLDSLGIAELEIDGLRPYRDGSPASRIHWPAVARTGEMIERRLTSGGSSRPLVVLDLRGRAERSVTEPALRAAASLCVRLAEDGGCELLLPGERRPLAIDAGLRAWPEAHVRIALAGPGAPAGTATALRTGAVFWISVDPTPPRLLSRLGGSSHLVTPGRPRAGAAFEVAGCYGRTLATAGRRGRAPAGGRR